MTESIAEGLSVIGLVTGFPLLLLIFMISMERLETWGLRDQTDEQRSSEANDAVEAAVEELEQLATVTHDVAAESTAAGRSIR